MKCISVIAMTLLVALTGCKKGMGDQYRDSFENADAVTLNDVIEKYQQCERAKQDGKIPNYYSVFYGKDEADTIMEYDDVKDSAFALQLPEYATSTHPFLSRAEVLYNSCVFAFNVWSNHEVWMTVGDDAEHNHADYKECLMTLSHDCIRDPELRQAAKTYKDSIELMMRRPYEEWEEDENSFDLLMAFANKIEAKSYQFFSDESMFVDSLDAMIKELTDATKPTLELYKKTDASKRLETMLHSLNDCSTFDEQCSLFLNWADCPESEEENVWIIAVAERLMNSGKYNPCLNNIWIIWRCLFQYNYWGISHESFIPNNFYNKMRKQCYLTCLKRIEQHPDDIFAMNCAAAIGGRANINRYGQFMFGNECITEMYEILPGRFEEDEGENEE